MTTKNEKDCAGKALYCEIRRENYTFQLILTPNLVDRFGAVAGLVKASRRISTYHPRRNWNIEKLHAGHLASVTRDAYGRFEALDLDSAVAHAETTYSKIYGNVFANLNNQGWTLYKKPLVVEFTYGEFDTLNSGKLPISLYRRIERVRTSQGWSKSMLTEETV